MAEEKLETFEDKMNFLAKDEQEAIDGYDKVIALLDPEKDKVVIEQLNKIKTEEVAHKAYAEGVINNHDLIYTEPLEQEEVKESFDYNSALKDAYKALDDAKIHFNVDKNVFEFNTVEDARSANAILTKVFGADKVCLGNGDFNVSVELTEGAEGHRVPGKEYVIYEIDDEAKKAPIVAIRKTYTEAQYFCNKDENFTRELGIEEVPVGKFKKGDDFYGPFDGDLNLIEEKKEDHVIKYIEMPHEVYTTKEDIIRINKELEEKAKAGQLIGIRKEPKMLMLSEPAINGIWTIYLNDEGFIEKIVVF